VPKGTQGLLLDPWGIPGDQNERERELLLGHDHHMRIYKASMEFGPESNGKRKKFLRVVAELV
jgi:hypothetical protein